MTEEKESELEEFLEFSKIVISALGYKVFVPLVTSEEHRIKIESTGVIFYLNRKSKKSNTQIQAKCERTDEGFVVLKGSMIEEIDSRAIPKSIQDLRAKSKRDNDIIDGVLQKNFLFNSPSYAAAFVLGMQTNGRIDWKTQEGITVKELEEKEMD